MQTERPRETRVRGRGRRATYDDFFSRPEWRPVVLAVAWVTAINTHRKRFASSHSGPVVLLPLIRKCLKHQENIRGYNKTDNIPRNNLQIMPPVESTLYIYFLMVLKISAIFRKDIIHDTFSMVLEHVGKFHQVIDAVFCIARTSLGEVHLENKLLRVNCLFFL